MNRACENLCTHTSITVCMNDVAKFYKLLNIKKILFLSILFVTVSLAQTDWKRWEKVEIDYSFNHERVKQNSNPESSYSPLSILKDGYSFLISNLDGDNCPFYPTCSAFFVESVSKTNTIKGTLMFADRFTRDSNLFKTHAHYPKYISGKLYDPTHNYQLIYSNVIYYSREKIVN